MQEFFGEYINIITGLSVGTVTMILWRILVFFKKDRYLLPFVNIAKTKATELFGAVNVESFINIAKNVKVDDIPIALKEFADKQLNIEKMLALLLANQINLGVYDDNPEIKAEIENLL